MKRYIEYLAWVTIASIVILVLLFLFKNQLLNPIIDNLMEIRGTSNYEGETKSKEVFSIVLSIIIPLVFGLIFMLFFITKFIKKS